jgi:large subunit ribosomal protein L15
LENLESLFKDGDVVSPEVLVKMDIVDKIKGRAPKVKILGTGKLTKKLIFENCTSSKTAKEAIEKAGGTIK